MMSILKTRPLQGRLRTRPRLLALLHNSPGPATKAAGRMDRLPPRKSTLLLQNSILVRQPVLPCRGPHWKPAAK
jgi:hypothetical protein